MTTINCWLKRETSIHYASRWQQTMNNSENVIPQNKYDFCWVIWPISYSLVNLTACCECFRNKPILMWWMSYIYLEHMLQNLQVTFTYLTKTGNLGQGVMLFLSTKTKHQTWGWFTINYINKDASRLLTKQVHSVKISSVTAFIIKLIDSTRCCQQKPPSLDFESQSMVSVSHDEFISSYVWKKDGATSHEYY